MAAYSNLNTIKILNIKYWNHLLHVQCHSYDLYYFEFKEKRIGTFDSMLIIFVLRYNIKLEICCCCMLSDFADALKQFKKKSKFEYETCSHDRLNWIKNSDVIKFAYIFTRFSIFEKINLAADVAVFVVHSVRKVKCFNLKFL